MYVHHLSSSVGFFRLLYDHTKGLMTTPASSKRMHDGSSNIIGQILSMKTEGKILRQFNSA